jgi:hypothetical protein
VNTEKKAKNLCPYQELNHNFTVVNPQPALSAEDNISINKTEVQEGFRKLNYNKLHKEYRILGCDTMHSGSNLLRFLQNVCEFLAEHMASHPTRQYCSQPQNLSNFTSPCMLCTFHQTLQE